MFCMIDIFILYVFGLLNEKLIFQFLDRWTEIYTIIIYIYLYIIHKSKINHTWETRVTFWVDGRRNRILRFIIFYLTLFNFSLIFFLISDLIDWYFQYYFIFLILYFGNLNAINENKINMKKKQENQIN